MASVRRRPEFVLLAIFPSIAVGLVNGLYAANLAATHPVWYWLMDVGQFVLLPAVALFILHSIGGYRPSDYGFRRFLKNERGITILGLMLFVPFVYWMAYEPVNAIAYRFFWFTVSTAAYTTVLPTEPLLRVPVVFYICVTAALVEEPVFRSLPWLYFSSTLSSPIVPYVTSTAILFAAVHWEHGLPNLIATGTLGLAAALLYVKILNIWPFICAHFLAGAWSYEWL